MTTPQWSAPLGCRPGRVRNRVADGHNSQSTRPAAARAVLTLAGVLAHVPAAFRQLEANLARVSAEKAEAEAGLQAETTQLAALNALAQRAAQRVGSCPSCGQQITGHDLLATGQCGTCGRYGCSTAGRVSWT